VSYSSLVLEHRKSGCAPLGTTRQHGEIETVLPRICNEPNTKAVFTPRGFYEYFITQASATVKLLVLLSPPQEDGMPQSAPYATENRRTVPLDSNREALIPTLKEFQRRIEHLATYLEDLEEESLALRSAAENIEYVIERLTSPKETLKARTSGH
jgi:hypothetical protein